MKKKASKAVATSARVVRTKETRRRASLTRRRPVKVYVTTHIYTELPNDDLLAAMAAAEKELKHNKGKWYSSADAFMKALG